MSDAPQGQDWWQASDGKWYPPADQGAAPKPASSGGMSLPGGLPKMSSSILTIAAWAVLVLGVVDGFWSAFIASGPDDFTDKISFMLSSISGWAVTWAILLVAATLAARDER